jgi:hypothetical protein
MLTSAAEILVEDIKKCNFYIKNNTFCILQILILQVLIYFYYFGFS